MQSASVAVRAWQDGDLQRLVASSPRLSPQTLQLRFHGGMHSMPAGYLRLLDDGWHRTWEGVVAVSGDTLLGWAELGWTADDPSLAEVAVCVIDDEQGHGLGTRLLGAVTALARELGFVTLHVDIAADNGAARRTWKRVIGTAASTVRVPAAA